MHFGRYRPGTAATPMHPGGSYRGKTDHASQWWARRFLIHNGQTAPYFAVMHKTAIAC
jgi:hypothetical protein